MLVSRRLSNDYTSIQRSATDHLIAISDTIAILSISYVCFTTKYTRKRTRKGYPKKKVQYRKRVCPPYPYNIIIHCGSETLRCLAQDRTITSGDGMQWHLWRLLAGFSGSVALLRILGTTAYTWQEVRDKFVVANPTLQADVSASMNPGAGNHCSSASKPKLDSIDGLYSPYAL